MINLFIISHFHDKQTFIYNIYMTYYKLKKSKKYNKKKKKNINIHF